MTITFKGEGFSCFFRTTANKFILDAPERGDGNLEESGKGKVGHQVSRNEGWRSNGRVRVHKNYFDTFRLDSPLLSSFLLFG